MDDLSGQPYLSVVVASRNDTHGGDPLARLQTLVNTFSAQCSRYGLDAELIVVDWNPPADRPRLRDAVRTPSPGSLALRFVEVPPELHLALPFSDGLPLFQMIAKNVGLRRARGRFVLSTNIDIVLSNELVQFLAEQRLEPGRMYRVDRHDIDNAIPVDAPLEQQMAYCATHQIRVHGHEGTYAVTSNGCPAHLDGDVVDQHRVSIGRGWHVREGDAQSGWYRWATADAHLIVNRGGDARRDAALELEFEPNPYQLNSWCDLEVLDGTALLARTRISSEHGAVVRFAVALPDGVESHDIAIHQRGSSEGRQFLPLFEGRAGLDYRLRSAKLRTLPLASGSVHTYPSAQLFQAHRDGIHDFAVRGASDVAVLDDVNGIERTAEKIEVFDRGERLLFVSVPLRADDTLWLQISGADGAAITGSVAPGELRPTGGAAARIAVGARRLTRAGQRAQREVRAQMTPRLRRWVDRVEPVAPPPPKPSLDDQSGTTEEMAAIRDFLRQHRAPLLHQNACGDFQLMAREHWFEVRGFAEFPTYSMSLDGLLSATAASAGVVEEVLDMPRCIYHLEHEKGSGWTPEGESALRKRLADRGVTWVDHRTIRIWSAYMMWLKRPMMFNGSDWGLGSAALVER